MTAVSTLCSAVMLPLNLTVYVSLLDDGADIKVPWGALLQGVATVCIAILSGIAMSTKFPQLRGKMTVLGNVSGVCMILLTAIVSMAPKKGAQGKDDGATPLWGKESSFYVVVAAPFFVSLLTSLLISSLRVLQLARPERVAITIEVCYQNIGIASAVALAAYCDQPALRSDAAAVPIIYGTIQATFLGFFCIVAWKADWTYAPAKATLFEILRGDFQPCLSEMPCRAAEGTAEQLPSETTGESSVSTNTQEASMHVVEISESSGSNTTGGGKSPGGAMVLGRPHSLSN